MDLIERPGSVDRRHPWEVVRARFFIGVIERFGLATSPESVLDVGAGDAWFAQQLQKVLPASTRLVCWDTHYPTADHPDAAAGTHGIEFTAHKPSGPFDGILMLDVVEHVEDDVDFVREVVAGSLAPGGWVLVSVPAYQSLFGAHDRALRHFRRYSPTAICGMLETAGLVVTARGGLFHGLLPVRAAQVLRERYRPPDEAFVGVGAWHGGDRVTKALTFGLQSEARLSLAMATTRFPALPGLTTWALCRRARRDGP